MRGDIPGWSFLGDMSSNMFAAFVLILLAAVVAQERIRPQRDPAAAAVERPLRLARRETLDAQEMVAMLFARRPGASGLAIDLAPARMVLSAGARETTILARPADAMAELGAAARASLGGDIRLYIFSNDLYDAVADGLGRFREITAPEALRSPDGATWSEGFRKLLVSTNDPTRFAQGLAALLNGGPSTSAAAASGGAADLSKLAARASFAVGALAIFVALVFLTWVEIATRPRF